MQLVEKFNEFIRRENLFQPKDKLLLAVSGGVDSIVLCELCKRSGYDFVIAHCNFKLRGEESERDEVFVKKLALKYGVEIFVKAFETQEYADKNKCSIQEAARTLRYEWFAELIAVVNNAIPPAKFIVTAHHADDNIETLLMNFFKGTGIRGLRGILPLNGKIIRPLLFAHKEQLVVFARENNLQFLEDSSNLADKYTRNYFRNQVIPTVINLFPQVQQNLETNLQRFRDIEILYHQAISVHTKKLLVNKGPEVHIPVLKLLKAVPLHTIIYELTRPYGFSPHQIPDIIHLLVSESGKYVRSTTHRIIRNRKWLIISPNSTTTASNILIEENDRIIEFNGDSKLRLEVIEQSHSLLELPVSDSIASIDAAEIKFPLLLRKWKQGDYFYPLGMRKKKKLSRFFIDQKLSLPEKENTWVIEMKNKIAWIVGRRIDDRFKVTKETTSILRITLS